MAPDSVTRSIGRSTNLVAIVAVLVLIPVASWAAETRLVTQSLASGAIWIAEVPKNWNGALLLFSHGANPGPANPPRNQPRNGAAWFLDHGYALVGSSYSTVGWAVEDAISDQLATLDAFTATVGTPTRVIAYGESMGGLVTLALIERHPQRFDGAMAMCASVAGVVGMMNQALDATFVLKTLVDPNGPLSLVGDGLAAPITGSTPNAAAQILLDNAYSSALGRARVMIAATLAQLPPLTDWRGSDVIDNAEDAEIAHYYRSLMNGAFFPRLDQERRAKGNASWNTGVDYSHQLDMSGRRPAVEAAYLRAGASLQDDLNQLARATRIPPDPRAIQYMRRNYVPSGDLSKPVLTIHETGDPMTMVTYEQAYGQAVAAAGKTNLLRQAFVDRQGHCTFSAGETAAGLLALEQRIETGRWDDITSPQHLNARASNLGLGPTKFIEFSPSRFLRPCSSRELRCAGEP